MELGSKTVFVLYSNKNYLGHYLLPPSRRDCIRKKEKYSASRLLIFLYFCTRGGLNMDKEIKIE